MAKVEVEESVLAALQSVNKFADEALKNPKTRRQMLAIDKTLNPDKAIPELDATDHVMTAVRGVEEKVDSFMKKLDERAAADDESRRTSELQGKIQAGQQTLRTAGYNADGIAKIEKLMLDRGIADYESGLVMFEHLNPPPAPADSTRSSYISSSSDFDMGAPDFKELMDSQGMSDAWLEKSLQGSTWGRRN